MSELTCQKTALVLVKLLLIIINYHDQNIRKIYYGINYWSRLCVIEHVGTDVEKF